MSRLTQMQARFQQKQIQEKEEKLLRLFEQQQQRTIERVNKGSAGSTGSITAAMNAYGGKVRQMFDERRQKAGIDRSYPLEPIKKTNSGLKPAKTLKKTPPARSNGKVINVTKHHLFGEENYEDNNNINGLLYPSNRNKHHSLVEMMNNHHIGDIEDESFPDDEMDYQEPIVKPRLANVGGMPPSHQHPVVKKSVERKGVKVVSPKTETRPIVKKTITKSVVAPGESRSSSNVTSRISSNASLPAKAASEMSRKPAGSAVRTPTQRSNGSAGGSVRSAGSKVGRGPPMAVARDDLDECKYCGRRFAADRLGVHEDICARTARKKRKTYDATKHRVEGTELESYVRRGKGAAASKQTPTKKGNWRAKHEEFINAIRNAKMTQAHLARGGRLSELPPPPPSTNPDYVQCPHCGRRFNEAAAERHIPKCASYDYNKPKAPQAKQQRGGASRQFR